MSEHVHVVLKNGRDLEAGLVPRWRDIAAEEGKDQYDFLIEWVHDWWGDEVPFTADDVASVRVAS